MVEGAHGSAGGIGDAGAGVFPVHELVPGAGGGVGEVVGGNVHGCEQVVGNGCDEG